MFNNYISSYFGNYRRGDTREAGNAHSLLKNPDLISFGEFMITPIHYKFIYITEFVGLRT